MFFFCSQRSPVTLRNSGANDFSEFYIGSYTFYLHGSGKLAFSQNVVKFK